ncbi:MAG: 50S ribosomal protein L10 [bacterium]
MSSRAAVKGRMTGGRPPRTEKTEKVEALRERFSRVSAVVLMDFRGLNVAQMTALRKRTREAGVQLSVVKNTLLHRAVEGTSFEALREGLSGPISIATTEGDPSIPARVLNDFLKGAPSGEIRGGVLDGKFLEPSGIKELAELPPREVLLGLVLATMQAPVAGLPRLLNAFLSKLVYVLRAIAKKGE